MVKQRDKVYMPMGSGGLMRYQEEEEEMFVLKPKHVAIMVICTIAFEVLVKFFF